MNFVEYLIARAKFSGLAGGVQGDIQALRVIENGTFEAPAGTAGYNPVVVNVLDPENGSPLKFTSGSFRPMADRTRMTIEHGLGCMPDFVMVYQVGIADYSTMEEFCEDLPILFAWGFKSSFNAGFLTGLNVPGWGFTQKQYGIDNVPEESQDSGYIYCPDESTFQVGMVSTSETGSIGLASGATYNWIAVAGLGTVSEPVAEPLAITENGTYNAPEGVDGYNPVVVNVAGGSSADVRYVTFMSYDGLVEYGKKAVAVGDDCADPIARGIFATPTRDWDGTYDYEFAGKWTATIGGTSNNTELQNITENKTLYAVFNKISIAYKGNCGTNANWRLNNNGVMTIYGTGDMVEYSNVTTRPWHSYISNIKKAIIEDGITSISQYIFHSCTNLTSAIIPNSVSLLPTMCFYDCANLDNVIIPDSCTEIGMSAFCRCTSLKNINIPNKVVSIGQNVFYGCTGLLSVTLPDGIITIPRNAFYKCTSLQSININNGCTTIGNQAFCECSSLTSVTIPANVSVIYQSFENCSRLSNVTILDGDVSLEIAYGTFANCTMLTSIIIPGRVNKIGKHCFKGCAALADATFINPVDWYAADTSTATSGTEIPSSNLSNQSTAATYLTSTYAEQYLFRVQIHEATE